MGNEPTKSLKTLCDMARLRCQHHRNGDANKAISEERQAIKFLQEDDVEKALGRAAWVVKYENLNKVRDKLVIMLDTLGRKHNKVVPNKTPEDLGIAEIVYSIMYLAKELDADRKGDNKRTELQDIAYYFGKTWGKKWAESNENNESGQVSQLIIKFIQEADDPTRAAIQNRLKEAGIKFGVMYDPGQDAEAEQMGGINTWRNEYTVSFESKPFGMEWTGTKDGLNLWVSSVDPQGLAHVKKVIPGSMIIALNGGDVQNVGAKKIHEKTIKLGLPLRVTFRKPEGMGDGNNGKQQFALDEEIIKKCVAALSDPSNWDLSKDQKYAMCKKLGASEAEISCAKFLSEQSIQFTKQQQQMQAQMQQQMQQMSQQMQMQQQQMMSSQQQSQMQQPQQPSQPVNQQMDNNYNQFNNNGNNMSNMNNNNMNSNMGMNGNINNSNNNNMNSNMNNNLNGNDGTMGSMNMGMPSSTDAPPASADAPPAAENDMDDLEARFAALRKGLQ